MPTKSPWAALSKAAAPSTPDAKNAKARGSVGEGGADEGGDLFVFGEEAVVTVE